MNSTSRIGWPLWVRWVIGTLLGGIVGGLGSIVLSFLVVNIFYPKETNLIVGLCLGTAMAMLQKKAVSPWLKLSMNWVWGAALMMAPPFILDVLFEELSLDMNTLPVQVVFGAIAIAGALLGAFLQARALDIHTTHPNWWIGAMGISWGLAFASGRVFGVFGAGVTLAAVSGALLIALLRANPRTEISG